MHHSSRPSRGRTLRLRAAVTLAGIGLTGAAAGAASLCAFRSPVQALRDAAAAIGTTAALLGPLLASSDENDGGDGDGERGQDEADGEGFFWTR